MIRPANMDQNDCKICGYLGSEFLFSAEGKRYAPVKSRNVSSNLYRPQSFSDLKRNAQERQEQHDS